MPELVDLLHKTADEIELRAMEQAGERCVSGEIAKCYLRSANLSRGSGLNDFYPMKAIVPECWREFK